MLWIIRYHSEEMASQANQALPAGTRLENYRIQRTLASGGFSIVYLAHDENESPVVIKEYLPSILAVRTEAGASPKVAATDLPRFRYGLKCFFEEGRALAKLQHPNVVRVLNFFRANETVYLVMRYERGRSLQKHIENRKGLPDETWLRSTFSPLLIDFGAARQTLTAEGVKLPPTYTPGFAAPEQYARKSELGPWTDIYSVGATVYSCLAGAAPQAAHLRLEKDQLVPARRAWDDHYSSVLLDIIDWCLRLEHLERPQSVFALQKALLGEKEPERQRPAPLLRQLKGVLKMRPK